MTKSMDTRAINKWNKNRAAIVADMEKQGNKLLGAGCFGSVFEHPTDSKRVIKYGPLSDGWVAFAAWVDAHKSLNNPHLPVIHSFTRFERGGYYRVEMERLETTVWAYTEEKPNNMFSDWENIAKCWFRYGTTTESDDWDAVRPKQWERLLNRIKCRATLEPVLHKLRDFAIRFDLSRDLHSENVMLRRVGRKYQLVITDPFSFGEPDKAIAALSKMKG
jgi:hypothetical protein